MTQIDAFRLVHRNEINKIILFVLLIFHSNLVFSQSNANLLSNNSFENIFFMQNYVFSDWLSPHNEYVIQSKDYVFDGRYSAKMCSQKTGNTAAVSQIIEVVPNSKIRICHHYYITQWKDKGARMYCYFRERQAEASNLSNDYLKNFYDTKTLRIIRGGGYDLTYFPHTTNQWLLFDEVITVPPDAYFFVFEIHSFYGTTIYIDDCYVGYEDYSIIEDLMPHTDTIDYYSLNGQKLAAKPSTGAYIIHKTDANGNRKVSKHI